MGILERISQARRSESRDNQTTALNIVDWSKEFRPGSTVNYNGRAYQAYQMAFQGLSNAGLYEKNSVVFAVEAKRLNVFSEARFQYQGYVQGRPGKLFSNKDLQIFEEPWPGASLRDLLCAAEFDVATAGNSYWIRDPSNDNYLQRLDPAKMKIITTGIADPVSGRIIGEKLIGYGHIDGDKREDVTIYSPQEIAHYKPYASFSQFVGQSWMTPCFNEVDADDALTTHKRTVMRDGAHLNTVVSLDPSLSPDEFKRFVEIFKFEHQGPENAGKTLFLGGGADVHTVSQTFGDLALHITQGATETRIAACAGVHPVVAGLSEGMKGSSLNAGNYLAAKRNFVDGTMRPLWGAFASAFRWIVRVPAGSRLWYDDRDIAFLREDLTDQAEILHKDATTIRQLTDAGFKPDAVIQAVNARDLNILNGEHSGLFSVQLQPPGLVAKPIPAAPALPAAKPGVPANTTNGNNNAKQA